MRTHKYVSTHQHHSTHAAKVRCGFTTPILLAIRLPYQVLNLSLRSSFSMKELYFNSNRELLKPLVIEPLPVDDADL